IQAYADNLEASSAIGLVGGLEPGELGDAGPTPGRPEVDQNVLATIGCQPYRLPFEILRDEVRRRLTHAIEPLQIALNLLLEIRAIRESAKQRVVHLLGDLELARGHRSVRQRVREASREFLLLVLIQSLHQFTKPRQRIVKPPSLGSSHRQD